MTASGATAERGNWPSVPAAAILLAATAASLALWLVGAPVPFLSGGLIGAWAAAVSLSLTVETPRSVDVAIQGAVGGLVGLEFRSEALRGSAESALQLLVIVAASLAFSVACGFLLVRGGISRRTAAFSAVAGGAAGVVPLARDLGGDDRVVAALQYLRVAAIVMLLPVAVPLFPPGGAAAQAAYLPGTGSGEALGIGAIASAAALCVVIDRLPHFKPPIVLVGLLAGWVVATSPLAHELAVPPWLTAVVFLLMGATIGARFTTQLSGQVLRLLPWGFIVIALVLLGCAALGLVLSLWTGRPLIDGYLATTPGGLPAVLAAGTATDADTTFITSAQIVRLLAVLVAGPIVAKMAIARWGSAD